MEARPLRSEDDYKTAMKRIDELIDCEDGSEEEMELEVISLLVWDYEGKHHKIGRLAPIRAIAIRMDELGLKQKDLVKIIGDKSRVSDIMSMKRKLTLRMIRDINKALQIPLDTLVQEYWGNFLVENYKSQ